MITNLEADHIQAMPEELESPVTSPEIEAPSAFATASLRAELAAGDADETMVEVALPLTYPAALARQREVTASVPTDAKSTRERNRQLKALAGAVHDLSQAAPAPSVDHKKFWARKVPASALEFVAAQYPKTKTRKAGTFPIPPPHVI